jgi:hypothetical protein
MYKPLSPSVLKELEEQGLAMYVPEGETKAWTPTPHRVYFMIGIEREHIFDCSILEYDNTIHIANVETADFLKKEERGLIEAYLYLAIKGAIRQAKSSIKDKDGVKLIFDSYISSTPECLANLGFDISPSTTPYRGYLELKELVCRSDS